MVTIMSGSGDSVNSELNRIIVLCEDDSCLKSAQSIFDSIFTAESNSTKSKSIEDDADDSESSRIKVKEYHLNTKYFTANLQCQFQIDTSSNYVSNSNTDDQGEFSFRNLSDEKLDKQDFDGIICVAQSYEAVTRLQKSSQLSDDDTVTDQDSSSANQELQYDNRDSKFRLWIQLTDSSDSELSSNSMNPTVHPDIFEFCLDAGFGYNPIAIREVEKNSKDPKLHIRGLLQDHQDLTCGDESEDYIDDQESGIADVLDCISCYMWPKMSRKQQKTQRSGTTNIQSQNNGVNTLNKSDQNQYVPPVVPMTSSISDESESLNQFYDDNQNFKTPDIKTSSSISTTDGSGDTIENLTPDTDDVQALKIQKLALDHQNAATDTETQKSKSNSKDNLNSQSKSKESKGDFDFDRLEQLMIRMKQANQAAKEANQASSQSDSDDEQRKRRAEKLALEMMELLQLDDDEDDEVNQQDSQSVADAHTTKASNHNSITNNDNRLTSDTSTVNVQRESESVTLGADSGNNEIRNNNRTETVQTNINDTIDPPNRRQRNPNPDRPPAGFRRGFLNIAAAGG